MHRSAGFDLFRRGGVVIGAVLDDFSVRYLRGPLLLQCSRQTHPELTENTSHCAETCFDILKIS